jgi:hypothetical protein
MHTTDQLLDAAKTAAGVSSDYKLGLLLKLSSDSAITNYRKGRSVPDDAVAGRLAEIAGMDVHYVLACVHAERSKDAKTAAVWRGLADRLAKASTAAAFFVVALGVTGSPDARAAEPSQAAQRSGLKIMSIHAGVRQPCR